MSKKTPPRPQQSKRGRAQKQKLIPVRAHERVFAPKDTPKPRGLSLAERFRGRS